MKMSSVVFMRGVNVGGARRFQPKLLAKDLEHLRAINLGAAGTFVIHGRHRTQALRSEFLSRLPFPAELMICQGSDLVRLADTSPFPTDVPADIRRFVSVLERRPRVRLELPLSYPPGDRWEVKVIGLSGRFALSLWRRLGRSFVDPNGVIEKHFKVRATTRNLTTILKVCDLLRHTADLTLAAPPRPRRAS